ncbi:MAG: hypothetical protein NDI80_03100 [Flavobacteriaceae bacterium]|nr:hypothetical protein [Flavobacteriaceae bacterium]
MINTGIWIDRHKAHIISIEDESEIKQTIIESDVEDFNVKGGSRSKTTWGSQDKVSERTYLERRKLQLKNYFHKIMDNINYSDAIAIYGPAYTKIHFKEEIKKNNKTIFEKIRIVKTEDSMTDNQFKALVKSFSNSINRI